MTWLGAHRVDLVECGSTNDEAARLARAGASHGTIVVAESQRAGRGRDGRSWVSPPGLGLYFSAIVRPPLPLADVPPMTLAIGIGACDAVRAFGAPAELKWPNDLLVGGRRKLGGVLVEAQSQGSRLEAVIVGIGINLGGAIPDDLADRATTIEACISGLRTSDFGLPPDEASCSSVAIEQGISSGRGPKSEVRSPLREPLIGKLCLHVARWIDRYVAIGLSEIIPAWHARMAHHLVAQATVNGRSITGEVEGLDTDGALLLREANAEVHRVRSGDVGVVATTHSL